VPANVTDAPADEVHGIAVSPDSKWIVTKGTDEGVRIWNADETVKAVIRTNRWSRYPVLSADGKSLFAAAPDAIALARLDLSNGKETIRYTFAEPATDQVSIYNFGVSADGRRIAALTQTINRGGGRREPDVATVTVWDVATANRVHTREVERADWFAYGAFSPDLRWYYIGHRTLSLAGGPESRLDMPDGWHAWHATVSPDGRLVAQTASEQLRKQVDGRPWYWSEDRGIVVHEAVTGKQVLNLSVKECGSIAFTLDSRGLIVTDADAITLWDLATQKTLLRHKAPSRFVGSYGPSFASSLKITPDGTRAVTGHIDTTALVWDLSIPARRAKPLSERELAAGWADLAGDDAAKAYAAIWSLADAPGDSVPFLRTRLRPAVAPTDDEVRKLFGRLDAPAFADREGAEKALRELGESVTSALRDRLKAGVSPEQKERIEKVLAAAAIPTLGAGDRLRQVRGVAALELAGTADARKLLGELARGAADDRLTREATAALQRSR
jgi:WD domain, G-beta repeat